jgi:predicted metal-dependent enzyme (double-stranded beta helix superfamily)
MQAPPVLEEFVATCRAAVAGHNPRAAVHEAMTALFARADELAAAIPPFAPDEVATSPRGFRLGGEHILHRDDELTVMVLDTLPGVVQPPHDHNMFACIGVFEGAEEQRFWSRTGDGVAPAAGRTLEAGDVLVLGSHAIHAISARGDRAARAIHVYLGDIYDVDRSIFNPETLAELPMTTDRYDEFCRAAARAVSPAGGDATVNGA